MKIRIIATTICTILLTSALLFLFGCGSQKAPDSTNASDKNSDDAGNAARAVNLMSGVTAHAVSTKTGRTDPDGTKAVMDFSVQLFQKSMETDGNTLISPLSVLYALAMTANGANGETLSQMEAALGLPIDQLNEYLYAYMHALPVGDKYKLDVANSIWFKDTGTFTPNQDFLQANANWYGAGIYKAPFNNDTLKEINAWVSKHTDGMIQNILNEIPPEAVMYLVNALAFDAEWQDIYMETQVRDGTFTTEEGTAQDAQFMYSKENLYLTDEEAAGFIKYYAGRKYAFAALLPEEGVHIKDYAASLTGEKLTALLSGAKRCHVNAAIPKFECAYSAEMSQILKTMGITDAFDGARADFSGIGSSTEGNLYISRILHKAFIAVDEKGTKAGAATVVAVEATSALIDPVEIKTVYLDRPFLYMLIDCETNLPVFIGTVMDIEQ
mgnify:FL=1